MKSESAIFRALFSSKLHAACDTWDVLFVIKNEIGTKYAKVSILSNIRKKSYTTVVCLP